MQHWVILPTDVNIGELECDKDCSSGHHSMFRDRWYEHILPQLRGLKWYGKGVIESIQGPGETIYVPNTMPHAVLNLDENMSVTENFMPISTLGNANYRL